MPSFKTEPGSSPNVPTSHRLPTIITPPKSEDDDSPPTFPNDNPLAPPPSRQALTPDQEHFVDAQELLASALEYLALTFEEVVVSRKPDLTTTEVQERSAAAQKRWAEATKRVVDASASRQQDHRGLNHGQVKHEMDQGTEVFGHDGQEQNQDGGGQGHRGGKRGRQGEGQTVLGLDHDYRNYTPLSGEGYGSEGGIKRKREDQPPLLEGGRMRRTRRA